jgi:hypothetical protein
MTYPPQQPGPYGPQDPYGQQQPYGRQPYGQQPQYGQQPYGQPQYGAPWGQQPGYRAGPPPKKSRAGLITALVVVAVLVIGGGVAAFLLLKDDGGGGSEGGGETPRAAADTFTSVLGTTLSTSLEDVDLAPLKPLTCRDDYEQLTDELADARRDQDSSTEAPEKPEKTTFGVTNFKEEGDGATFDMTQKRGEDESDPMRMDVMMEDGNWVVCGLYRESEDDPVPPTSVEDGSVTASIPNPIPKSSN